jgi:hypothetical protein
MTHSNDVQQKVDEQPLPLQLADIEVAHDICNNISGIISAEIYRIEQSGGDQSEIERLSVIRRRFLRDEKSKLDRDHPDYVRAFIEEYAPAVKANFTTGAIPDFLKE